MAIQGLSEYGGFYQNYKMNRIPKVDVETVKQQEQQNNSTNVAAELQKDYTSVSGTKEDSRSRIANLEDISLTFRKDDTFDYIGNDRDLQSLDIEKAVSDMKKDKVLQEYQYFVGSARETMMNQSEDGVVVQKFN